MRSSGNGNPKTCTENILKCTRGEIPYDRIKGLPASLIDSPYSEAAITARQEARWLIETYEPRVVIDAVEIKPDGFEGVFSITANVTEKEE